MLHHVVSLYVRNWHGLLTKCEKWQSQLATTLMHNKMDSHSSHNALHSPGFTLLVHVQPSA